MKDKTALSPSEAKKTQKKRTRKSKPNDGRRNNGKNPTPAQIEARVKKGQVLNPNGRPKTPEGLKQFRLDCEKILRDAGLPMLINHMYRPDITTRDLLDIIKFLTDRSYGKAKEVNYNEGEIADTANLISPIIISDELLEIARRNDSSHFEEED